MANVAEDRLIFQGRRDAQIVHVVLGLPVQRRMDAARVLLQFRRQHKNAARIETERSDGRRDPFLAVVVLCHVDDGLQGPHQMVCLRGDRDLVHGIHLRHGQGDPAASGRGKLDKKREFVGLKAEFLGGLLHHFPDESLGRLIALSDRLDAEVTLDEVSRGQDAADLVVINSFDLHSCFSLLFSHLFQSGKLEGGAEHLHGLLQFGGRRQRRRDADVAVVRVLAVRIGGAGAGKYYAGFFRQGHGAFGKAGIGIQGDEVAALRGRPAADAGGADLFLKCSQNGFEAGLQDGGVALHDLQRVFLVLQVLRVA